MTGIINSGDILNKLTDFLLVQGDQHVLLNGPERSGKSTIVNSFRDNLRNEGWSTITFKPDDLDFSKDLFEQFISILLMGIKRKLGQSEFLRFLKNRNLKNIVRKKIKTNNRAVAFRYFFHQDYKNFDVDKTELLNIQTLIEINEAIKKLNIKLLLVFNDFENCDLVSDLSEYKMIRKVKKYLTEAKMITTFNFSDMDSLPVTIKLKLERTFDKVIDLNKESLLFSHPNLQVNHFIRKINVKDIFLINSINESLDLPEKWLKRNFDFHEKTENRVLYYDEIYFVMWFLLYIRVKDINQYNMVIENIDLYDALIKNKLTAEEIDIHHNLGNLKYLKLLLKTRGYEFETETKYFEILNMIDKPLKSNNPMLITVETKPGFLNIINEYAFLFIFNCVLNNVENVIANDKAETLLLNFEENQKELEVFAKTLNPRNIKQITTSKEKELYDLNVFNIIKKLISKI
ncbi:ATP-binding protein [Spiroplasma sp. BIUS-1]|uniref:ATP-binding protein n=1 Tax=Spiroplasma sp. BIUS-1 TaxID=216964 RepID=UPI001398CF64|nr:ATP-binding protein [Spiroplasma sp. BIUS-1]QHX36627.1 ATP-binding protein [Spiroplasma sp. BIUS-1]